MLLHQRFIPGLAIASYFVADEKTGAAAVIDPTRDVDDFVDYARKHGLRINHILETHVHADFVSGAKELKERLGGVPRIHASGLGGDAWTPTYVDEVVNDGDEIPLGSLRLKALASPGHTPEHICWAVFDDSRSRDVPWMILTGDFLFVGDVGRPDLLGEEEKRILAKQLYQSVFERLPAWPDMTEIYPAHGAGSLCGKSLNSRRSSTVGFERHFNSSLVAKPEQQWVADLMAQMPSAPPYFRKMKEVNQRGPKLLRGELPGLHRKSVGDFKEAQTSQAIILDVRTKEAYAAAHIPGAVSIPLADTLPTWAGWVMPYDRPILLVADDPADVPIACTHLMRIGLDEIAGYLDGGMDAWQTGGQTVQSVRMVTGSQLEAQLRTDAEGVSVIDVRTDGEWNRGHIESAKHIPVGEVTSRMEEIPKDKPVAVVCGSAYRASIAASLLQQAGYEDVSNVVGGMAAWHAAGLPTA